MGIPPTKRHERSRDHKHRSGNVFASVASVGLFALTVAFGVGGCATTPATDASETPAAAAAPESRVIVDGAIRPFVWKVDKTGLPTSYLVGSIHALPSTTTMPAALETAWNETEVLVLELDAADPEVQAAVQQLTQRRMILPPPASLKTLISAKAFDALNKELSSFGLNPTLTAHLRPWAALIILSDVKMRVAGMDPQTGVEMRLSTRAADEKRPVVSLESPAEQIDAFSSLDEKIAATSLEELATTSTADVNHDMNGLIRAWRTGDDTALFNMATKDSDTPEGKAFLDATIFERNKTLARRAARLMEDQKRHMVVVGAAHTVGPGSVVEILEAAGFSLTRMPREPLTPSQ